MSLNPAIFGIFAKILILNTQSRSKVAMAARPRYHLSGGEDVHFARLPYANRDLVSVDPCAVGGVGAIHLSQWDRGIHSTHLLAAPKELRHHPRP